MVEGTRLALAEEVGRANKEEIAALQRGQVETVSQITATQGCLTAVESSLLRMEGMLKEALKMKSTYNPEHDLRDAHSKGSGNTHSSRTQPILDQGPQWPRGLKAELPMFDGEGVEEWVFKVKEYFEVSDVPVDMRIRMISFHLSGPAYTWYHWGVNNQIQYT